MHGVDEFGDGFPARFAGIHLFCRTGMECDGGASLGFGDAACFEVGLKTMVDSDPEFECHRNRARVGDGRAGNGGEEPGFHGDGGAAAAAGHLAHGASEVEVDMIDLVLGDEPANDFSHHDGIDRVELKASGALVRVEACEPQGPFVALQEGSGRDHLAHVETRPKASAERAVGGVRDPGHRGEDHGGPDRQRSDLGDLELAGSGQRYVAVRRADVAGVHAV